LAVKEGKRAVAGRGLVMRRANRSAIPALHKAQPVLPLPGGTGTPQKCKGPVRGFLVATQGRFKPCKLRGFFPNKILCE